VHEVEGRLTSAAGAGASVVKSEASKATSFTGVLQSKATFIAAPLISHATSVAASKISEAIPVATSLLGDLGHIVGFKRADAVDILEEVGQVTACLANAVTSNPLFQVGECAADLASLAIPALELLRLKKLIGVVGGVAEAVETLKNAKSVEDVVQGRGNALLDLLKGVANVSEAAKGCAFLV